MRRTFKSDVVARNHLTQMRIFQELTSSIAHDKWTLQGVKLRGRCADSLTELHLDKFQSENVESAHPHQRFGVSWLAWAGTIEPTKDWRTHVDCSHFKTIEVELRTPKSARDVKLDDLYVRFENEGIGRNTVNAKMETGDRGHFRVVTLRRKFGDDPTPVRDIKYFVVYSRSKQRPVPAWRDKIGVSTRGPRGKP